jgi:hypothetical protein
MKKISTTEIFKGVAYGFAGALVFFLMLLVGKGLI